MLVCKESSHFNIRLEYVDHDYQSYRTITDFIKRFINQAILNTFSIIDNLGDLTFDNDVSFRKLGYFGNEWATCGSFNSRNGLESITSEMKSWNALSALKDWMFHINFIGLQHKQRVEIFTYQVIWSVPTPEFPEPMVTVSVYFHVAISYIYPPHYPADITYVFEGHQFKHSLNMIFRPKWLYDILDMKTIIFKTIDF